MPPPIDLSKVTKLKDVQFDWTMLNVQWITLTLATTKSKNLQQVSLHSGVRFVKLIGDVEQAQVYSIYYSSTLILPSSGEGRGC